MKTTKYGSTKRKSTTSLSNILVPRRRSKQQALVYPKRNEDTDSSSFAALEFEVCLPPLEDKKTSLRKETSYEIQRLYNEANALIFGNSSFRTKQEEAIKAVLANEDVLVLFPTGGGKSLCYQLPAIISKGVTIVISPLVSLINDQHKSLIDRDIPSTFLNSQQKKSIGTEIIQHLKLPKPYLKILFTTPETINKSSQFKAALVECYKNGMLTRFAVDECHCVSTWGHDFRPEYRKLGELRTRFPEVPIVALTATASSKTIKDITTSLSMKNATIIRKSFNRENLKYSVISKPEGNKALELLLKFITKYPSTATGIVYCLTQKDSEKLAAYLVKNGVKCDYYHAGMNQSDRELVQAGWSCGVIQIVCATIAYGMGIDKSDVRFVIHFCIPKSIEGYFQESGRAGRDGRLSDCILFYRKKDAFRVQRLLRLPTKGRSRAKLKNDLRRLDNVVSYCENVHECRRKLLLGYFEATSYLVCCPKCDVCEKRSIS